MIGLELGPGEEGGYWEENAPCLPSQITWLHGDHLVWVSFHCSFVISLATISSTGALSARN